MTCSLDQKPTQRRLLVSSTIVPSAAAAGDRAMPLVLRVHYGLQFSSVTCQIPPPQELENPLLCHGKLRFFLPGFFPQSLSCTGKFLLSAGPHLDVRRDSIIHEYFGADLSHTRCVAEGHQDNLKRVTITGFCSAKSLIELTCQILESSSSLQCLVLDTASGYDNSGICEYMERKAVMEALRGVEAIKKYIKGKVPSRVNLEVLEPWGRCHIPNLHKTGR
ncbi:hypothetical protein C2845_PM10G00540 [Panicum miliaceum]|uniref:At1g61320/AtMIF1 LRR domain-containing protein n=1 Tax=Panicum miliaceum TaxID=4540 RepID=A0A3L6PDK9_PANMI|nr:hypothetical protein C2845_PM10G00540 [Panicum miliaceum]